MKKTSVYFLSDLMRLTDMISSYRFLVPSSSSGSDIEGDSEEGIQEDIRGHLIGYEPGWEQGGD